jgi:hypothetical protein
MLILPIVDTLDCTNCKHCWDPNMYTALLTSFIRRPDDGPVGTETCSLPYNKYYMPDVNCFIILIIKILAHRDVFNKKKFIHSNT